MLDDVYFEKALKELKNINLNLSRLTTMFNDFLNNEYGIEYTFHDDDLVELPNIPPCSDEE